MKLTPSNTKIPYSKKNYLRTPASTATNYLNYSEKDKILEIEYKQGNIYQYLNVPMKHWLQYREAVISGDSSGVYVNKLIKEAGYDYREVEV